MALEAFGFICNSHPLGWAFGWYTNGNHHVKMINMDRKFPDISDAMCNTVMNIVSYIPILCILSGIYHSRRAEWIKKRVDESDFQARDRSTDKDDLKFYAAVLHKRAIAEYCQATVLLLFADVIASVGRLHYFRPKRVVI